MVKNMTDKKIDIIYDAMDALMKADCWEYINDRFFELKLQAWRHDLDILLAYIVATQPVKTKLPNRKIFIDKCKELHPNEDWSRLI